MPSAAWESLRRQRRWAGVSGLASAAAPAGRSASPDAPGGAAGGGVSSGGRGSEASVMLGPKWVHHARSARDQRPCWWTWEYSEHVTEAGRFGFQIAFVVAVRGNDMGHALDHGDARSREPGHFRGVV